MIISNSMPYMIWKFFDQINVIIDLPAKATSPSNAIKNETVEDDVELHKEENEHGKSFNGDLFLSTTIIILKCIKWNAKKIVKVCK